MRIHTGVKPYACNKCTYRSAQRTNLKKHVQRYHSTSSPSAAEAPSSPSAAKAPTSKVKLRRCAEPFTLFKIYEFESEAESVLFASMKNNTKR